MAYLPNAPQYSRRIHQRGQSSLRSLFSIIQPSQTVLPVPGSSIILADNNSNWEDASTNPITNNNTANKPISSTHSWSKCQARFTPGWKSAEWTRRWVDLWNDLGFSLCAVLSVCHMVATSDEGEKVRDRSEYWFVCHRWTPEIEFNKRLSSSIIRLANYSVTTSLIYKWKV